MEEISLAAVIQVTRETHECPPEIAAVLRAAGGLNPFGEPNYRAVWGMSRLDWIGGKWADYDDSGNLIREVISVRHEPKYAIHRWIIERWMPPETYGTPESWHAQTLETVDGQRIPALGPYPARGDYEHCFTLESPKSEFVQLTAAAARHIARAIETSRQMRKMSRREFISRKQAQDDRDYDNYADEVLSDGPAFSGVPQISVL